MSHSKEYYNVQDLAQAIAKIPHNHDEYELVIADMIKKYVHQEKYYTYKWCWRLLECYKENPIFKLPIEYIETKIATHKTLMEKWCYGTYYSIGHYGIDPRPDNLEPVPSLIQHLMTRLDAIVIHSTEGA